MRWTRLAIVTFADGSAGFNPTAGRLLQNQTDIGDAIKPFYGAAAGNRLTALLHDHITIAVEILQAAKAGNTAAFNAANTRWYANGNDIADFLAAANPRSWPDAVMRADMKEHLDQTLAEAAHELHGQYAASVTDYEGVDGLRCRLQPRRRADRQSQGGHRVVARRRRSRSAQARTVSVDVRPQPRRRPFRRHTGSDLDVRDHKR